MSLVFRLLAALALASFMPAAAFSEDAVFGPNLIENPSVENAARNGQPLRWFRTGIGANASSFFYPVAGFNTPRGLQVAISSYTSGNARWWFQPVPVVGGDWYEFSDTYQATLPSELWVRYQRANGSITTQPVAKLGPAGSYTAAVARFIAPSNAASASVFHWIHGVGELRTDEFSLRQVLSDPTNLLANAGFEIVNDRGQPANWRRGAWGDNAAVFSYPVAGVGGSRAARVAITRHVSGDAKWYAPPIPLPRGTYTYTTDYKATMGSMLTLQLQNPDNSFQYRDLAAVPSAGDFVHASVDFWVPLSAKTVTMFHLMKGLGELTIDNAALAFKAAPRGIFERGAVSLVFDDGWVSQYENALPKLTAAGMKGTFYIVTRHLADTGYSGYMSRAQVQDLYRRGHEIGAHTRTHRDLTTLSPAEQQDEIQGSRQDLLAMEVGPVTGFAYPFGAYTADTLQLVKEAGFATGRATLPGTIVPPTDAYQLPRFSMEVTTTFEQTKQAIDQAVADKEWLILLFHQIQDGAFDRYTVSPALFNHIVDYLVQQGIQVLPAAGGIASM